MRSGGVVNKRRSFFVAARMRVRTVGVMAEIGIFRVRDVYYMYGCFRRKSASVMDKIDFVLPWVDGGDPQWQAEKKRYAVVETNAAAGDANADCRYRDYGLLRYWFRAVENFAPWVDRVFLVTCGQRPQWLDVSHPKLRLVDHAEYIPSNYLPTFHSNTIELNLHRIPDLAEHFVLFNDDLFLLQPVRPDFFFRDGLPVIPCDLGIPRWIGCSNISRIVINNSGVLKRNMDVERLVWKNMWKFADVRSLGLARAFKNFMSFAVNRTVIPGTFGHLAQSHLKSTFADIWDAEPHIMDATSKSRFRSDECVNHWLACAWNMISGKFRPANEKRRGRFVMLDAKHVDRICDDIRRRSFPEICLNDKGGIGELERCYAEVSRAFEKLFPERSAFEK